MVSQCYSGLDRDVRADVAWDYLKSHKNSHLVDVRTDFERIQYGIPDLNEVGRKVVCLSFVDEGIVNQDFIRNLKSIVTNDEDLVFFICKTGYRSKIASDYAFSSGYKNSINILGGFEGSTTIAGWKELKLAVEF
jgi:rhodanese-related sulfurtransferase